MMVSKLDEHFFIADKDSIPAVPQRPKPALRIVEPLLTSATALSALSHSFEVLRIELVETHLVKLTSEKRAERDIEETFANPWLLNANRNMAGALGMTSKQKQHL